MARKQNRRSLRRLKPTIVGAGITEMYYFSHLKKVLGYDVEILPRYFGSDHVPDMERMAERVSANGGIVICVFDMDETQWNAVEKKQKKDFIRKYQSMKDVILCPSMPCIEYWFLLHFKSVNRLFSTSDAVIKELVKNMPYEKKESFLRKPNWVENLLADDKQKAALKHSADLLREGDCSYTDIPKAIHFLEAWKIDK